LSIEVANLGWVALSMRCTNPRGTPLRVKGALLPLDCSTAVRAVVLHRPSWFGRQTIEQLLAGQVAIPAVVRVQTHSKGRPVAAHFRRKMDTFGHGRTHAHTHTHACTRARRRKPR
jgi:hypothetical protein